jgi:hypothetical protein
MAVGLLATCIVPVPGTTQMAHMLENIGVDDVKFTAD